MAVSTEPALEIAFVLAASYVTVQLVRNWRSFWDDRVTPSDWRLGRWAALVASVPVGVVVHEAGHVFAAKGLGLTVTGIHLALSHGSVEVVGYTTVTEEWIVSVAGYLAAAIVGVALVALGLTIRRPTGRELLITGGLLQLSMQLVIDPILNSDNWSDWSVIYDFGTTPGLSWLAALTHGTLLGAVWLWWNTRVRWESRVIRTGLDARRRDFLGVLRHEPGNVVALWHLGDLLGALGDFRSATKLLTRARAIDPASTDVLLARTRLVLHKRQWEDAAALTAEGLAHRGTDEQAGQLFWAYRGIALSALGRSIAALEAFARVKPPLSDHALVRYHRGLARLETGDSRLAEVDLRAALDGHPRWSLLRRHVEARLAGRRSQWRATLLDLGARVLRPETSVGQEPT